MYHSGALAQVLEGQPPPLRMHQESTIPWEIFLEFVCWLCVPAPLAVVAPPARGRQRQLIQSEGLSPPRSGSGSDSPLFGKVALALPAPLSIVPAVMGVVPLPVSSQPDPGPDPEPSPPSSPSPFPTAPLNTVILSTEVLSVSRTALGEILVAYFLEVGVQRVCRAGWHTLPAISTR